VPLGKKISDRDSRQGLVPPFRVGLIARMLNLPLSKYATIALCLAALCATQSGCLRRRLTVRTNPPGAQVFIDDQEVGTTPCSTAFVYYGTRKITLIKDGFRTETLYHRVSPPWYEYPPLDFFVENTVPQEIDDERLVDVQLVPQEEVHEGRLRERAESLRDQARVGQFTPTSGLPGSTPPPTSVEAETNVNYPGQGLPLFQPQPYAPPPTATGPLPGPRLTPVEEMLGEPPLAGAQP
jgi:hypothetical protein